MNLGCHIDPIIVLQKFYYCVVPIVLNNLFSKQAIIAAFEEVNLPIFKLQEDGNGTTMTGNLMRRIFRDHPQLFSDTTGIPLAVIKNTWTLYQAGVSRLPINPEAFSKLADETYRLYREVVPWYPICASFHRMLRHWPEILRLLPPTISIGMLSEVDTPLIILFLLSVSIQGCYDYYWVDFSNLFEYSFHKGCQ